MDWNDDEDERDDWGDYCEDYGDCAPMWDYEVKTCDDDCAECEWDLDQDWVFLA